MFTRFLFMVFTVKKKNSLHIRTVRVTLRPKHKNLTHISQRLQRLHTEQLPKYFCFFQQDTITGIIYMS